MRKSYLFLSKRQVDSIIEIFFNVLCHLTWKYHGYSMMNQRLRDIDEITSRDYFYLRLMVQLSSGFFFAVQTRNVIKPTIRELSLEDDSPSNYLIPC